MQLGCCNGLASWLDQPVAATSEQPLLAQRATKPLVAVPALQLTSSSASFSSTTTYSAARLRASSRMPASVAARLSLEVGVAVRPRICDGGIASDSQVRWGAALFGRQAAIGGGGGRRPRSAGEVKQRIEWCRHSSQFMLLCRRCTVCGSRGRSAELKPLLAAHLAVRLSSRVPAMRSPMPAMLCMPCMLCPLCSPAARSG